MPRFLFEELADAHLVKNAIYEGGPTSDLKYDPIPVLMRGSNVAGFRKKRHYTVLYTSGIEPNWPDYYDEVRSKFIYHGDRRSEKGDLHSTPGNRFLDSQYQLFVMKKRSALLPTFIFRKIEGYSPRAVQFLGLAVIGGQGMNDSEVLSTYWCKLGDRQFLNYRVVYTILKVDFVSRKWINDLLNDDAMSLYMPDSYKKFVDFGIYD